MKLLPDSIKEAWQAYEDGLISYEEFEARQAQLLTDYETIWTNALIHPLYQDLGESLIAEICWIMQIDAETAQSRCDQAIEVLAKRWRDNPPEGREAINKFYESPAYVFDLMQWHSLRDDNSPLAYVNALHFAQGAGCRTHLDFGSGVGSGTILFMENGICSIAADISRTLLSFAQRRFGMRGFYPTPLHLGHHPLPQASFDFITAMDVFEHLADPIQAVADLHQALIPGGYLFLQLGACKPDPLRPQHINTDPGPIFRKIEELGFVRVWCDDWVWGHDCFQKS